MLSKEQIKRYGRQLIIFGGDKQERLLSSSVLVVGAGGLGSPVIQYLAAAGVGKIGIADGDVVEISNLNRQTIHAGNLGMNKAESAAMFVERLNPDVSVKVYPFNITPRNAREIVRCYDVVADCTDGFTPRYILNDACVLEKVPLVHAAVLRFFGQLMTVLPGTACYRCFLPEAPSDYQTCREAGITGITTGFFGLLQANEIIKLFLNMGELMTNRILCADLLSYDFDIVEVSKNEFCPACGKNGIKEMREDAYEETCRLRA
ncbi:HesA/MoeB/ThiF family protein [Archaeoglobus neptunius]|uniref:HesA/MoeB/ThiF family protein n=1 Tax=Archaeoglobus neptunius TaxID=2798580 RepID=UPI0019256B78|nr:HesA/MoeB/ThiF family protein [Archaeoglobus neptunius]